MQKDLLSVIGTRWWWDRAQRSDLVFRECGCG